jgi:hypothetical protein
MTTVAHAPGSRRLNAYCFFVSPCRTRVLIVTIAAGLAAGLLLSPHAWFGNRLYPFTPILRWIGSLPRLLDVCLYVALLGALTGAAIAARPRAWITLAIALGGIFVCFDQSRLQPWVYQYLIMLAAIAVYGSRANDRTDGDRAALDVCRLAIVCIYFWSGAQKLNTDFIGQTFPWLIAPLTRFLPRSLASLSKSMGLIAPLAEIAIAIGLLTRRFRTYAIAGALGMHAILLFCLGPFGWDYNSVVWPWNIAMAACVVILFWRTPDLRTRHVVWPAGRGFHALVVLVFGIAPALCFVNLWDQYLSFGLYVRPRNELTLYVTSALAYRLPNEILRYVHPADNFGSYVIDVSNWSLSELNLTIYPEPRVYKTVGRFVCAFAQQNSDVRLVVHQSRVVFSPDRDLMYNCAALSERPPPTPRRPRRADHAPPHATAASSASSIISAS